MEKEKLFGKTLDELIVLTKRIRLPGYAARQIADWLYKKEITEIGEMSNLSKRQEIFSGSYETGLSLRSVKPQAVTAPGNIS